jgi:hypothetical protein
VAVQCGPIKLTGQLGGVSFYEMDGKFYARMKTAHSADRIKTDPAFLATHQNSLDFATAVNASKLLRTAWGDLTGSFADKRITGRLNGKFVHVLKGDTTSPRGSRQIACGDLSVLQGFELNKNIVLGELLPAKPVVAVNRTAGSVAVSLLQQHSLISDTHHQVVIAVTCINFRQGTHTTYCYEHSLADLTAGVNNPVIIDAPACANSQCTVIVTLGISTHNTAGQALTPSGNAMAIVGIEAPVSNIYSATVEPALHQPSSAFPVDCRPFPIAIGMDFQRLSEKDRPMKPGDIRVPNDRDYHQPLKAGLLSRSPLSGLLSCSACKGSPRAYFALWPLRLYGYT